MNVKFLKTTLAVVCVVAAGAGSWKAYSAYSDGQSEVNVILSENVEALSAGADITPGGYTISSGNCPYPCAKRWVSCKSSGPEKECYPSDCC